MCIIFACFSIKTQLGLIRNVLKAKEHKEDVNAISKNTFILYVKGICTCKDNNPDI